MIELRVLGPLEAVADGQPVELPGRKPRALLARLVLDAGRVVPVETLVESLWPASPPPSAYKVLQIYVSQLRKALGREPIVTRPPGYLLRVPRDAHDLGRFEALREAAREAPDPAQRAKLLRDALTLWRGPALAELREHPFALAAGRRLDDLRLGALEERIEAELELGEHARLVPELETLVDDEPLREAPLRQLMLALYRCGRQADALARYRTGRRLLVEELGIEPSPALQELERSILRHDPTLAERRTQQRAVRGAIVCAVAGVEGLLAPLCVDGRELILVDLAPSASELPERAARLERVRETLDVETRTACFTSTAPNDDLVRLATEQEAELLVLAGPPGTPAPCDVAVVARAELAFEPDGPVLVPFGGGREEWAALELGAWLARTHGLPLRLLGAAAKDGRRDASRTLAGASLALQRFAGTAAEPVVVAAGLDGILAERGSIVVASLPPGDLDATRRALVERTTTPVLLVSRGLRPGGLAPDRTLTRFSWSLDDA